MNCISMLSQLYLNAISTVSQQVKKELLQRSECLPSLYLEMAQALRSDQVAQVRSWELDEGQVQGYLAHKETPLSKDRPRALNINLL